MNPMMNTTGFGIGFGLLWGIHILSVVAFTVGILFLILWANKHLSGPQMKSWGIWLVVIGILACLLTIGVKGGPWMGYGMNGGQGMMRTKMMDRGTNRMMGGMMDEDDRMEMSMRGMSKMLEGKTGDAFDRAFLEGMIPHHQGAIEMAKLAQQNAKHDEIKRMASDIMSAQQREIDQMKGWMQEWGYTQ